LQILQEEEVFLEKEHIESLVRKKQQRTSTSLDALEKTKSTKMVFKFIFHKQN